MWLGVCSDVTVTRMRLVASGTVGGRIAGAYRPSVNRCSANESAVAALPTRIGMIGLTLGDKLNPMWVNPENSRSRFAHKRARRSGSRCRMRNAAVAAAAELGGGAVVKIKDRLVFMR